MIAAGQAGFQITPVGETIVLSVEVKLKRQADLLQIGKADRLLAFLLGPGERRQQHRGKDRDDRDHDQQLDQRESLARPAVPMCAYAVIHRRLKQF